MEVASMHLGVCSWSRQSPELQAECASHRSPSTARCYPINMGQHLSRMQY